jgi:PAS domain S-box-containing protein
MPDSLPSSVALDPAMPHSKTATVMIVAADEVLLVRIQELLARTGLTCRASRNGRAVLEPLSQCGVDLLLIDLPLPDLSGQELLKRQCKAKKPMPFIALVAPGEERLGLELMRAGALDCVLKDAQLLERLPLAIKRALHRLEQQDQLAAAQEALRQSEARHRALFELASVGMTEGDPQTGRFLRVNEKFCQITGYSAQELQATCFSEITHPEDREADWQAYQRAVRGEARDYHSEKRYLRKDGSTVWVRVNVFMIGDARGRPVRSVGVAEDITKRKRAEAELKGLKDQLAADFAAMNHLHELSTRLLDATGLRELLEEILEATIVLQNADFGNVQLYNRQSGALELVAQRGFQEDFLEQFRVVHGGEAACGLALQRRQRVIVEDTEADPAYAPYRAIAASAGYRAVQSTPMFSRDEEPLGVLSTHFRQPHHPSERDLRLTDLYVQQAAGLIGRTQAEEALRASEARYRALVHATSASVWRLTPDGERQLSLEGGVVRGHGEPEAQPGDWLRRIHPEDRARTHEAWRRAVATQSLYEIEHRVLATDGSYRHLLSRGVPVRSAEGRVLEWIGASTDITARKRAEAALRESEERFRRVSESGFISIALFGNDGRITDANDAFLNLVGFSRTELTGGWMRWDELTPREWLPRTREALEELKATGRIRPYEKEYFRRDGSRFWGLFGGAKLEGRPQSVAFVVDITEQKRAEEQLRLSEERLRFAAQAAGFGTYELDLVTGQAYRSPEYKALFGLQPNDEFQLDADQVPIYVHPDDRTLVREATRESRDPQGSGAKDVEYRVMLPDGTVRWLLVRGRTSFEGEGKARRPVRSRGIALDVTGRKQLEQEILEISGREQRRIGQDLHDDLCQRLGGLQLLSGVLEKELATEGHPEAPQAGRISSQVHEALERARLLARGLAPVAVEEGGLTTALEELADNAAQLFHIRCEFHGELPVGIADVGAATHLYRIAQEAITNAVKHGRAKRVVIDLTDAGDSFNLKVIDDGRGFGRTKAAAAGMGLRIMKYRAAMLGATLEVRSIAGQGTTVTCTFGKRLCSVTRSTNQRLRVGRGSQAR